MADEKMERATALAEKIMKKADDTLGRLQLEMDLMKWPQEYRAIMWNAVAQEAMRRAAVSK